MLNRRFREGRASSDVAAAGVVLHQFDGYESHKHPWAPCDNRGHGTPCQGQELPNRLSAMLIFASMRQRSDRVHVPLIGDLGGVVVSPSVPLKCAYGDDGSTWHAPDGCWQPWCDPTKPFEGGQWWDHKPCGFGSQEQIRRAWRPQDLHHMLALYNEHSQLYHAPGFYSGYNELVYASEDWNARLPRVIEAFFTIKNRYDGTTPDARRRFLRAFGLDGKDVPLLEFDPSNWIEPFRIREVR